VPVHLLRSHGGNGHESENSGKKKWFVYFQGHNYSSCNNWRIGRAFQFLDIVEGAN